MARCTYTEELLGSASDKTHDHADASHFHIADAAGKKAFIAVANAMSEWRGNPRSAMMVVGHIVNDYVNVLSASELLDERAMKLDAETRVLDSHQIDPRV